MPDFTTFAEGDAYLAAHGLPATCYFLLSTLPVASFSPGATLAGANGGVGEISAASPSTGYVRQSQAAPTPTGATVTFAPLNWSTGSATNWPSTVYSVVLATTANNTGVAICAWNLVPGGAPRDMSTANSTLQFNTGLQFTPAL